MLLDYFFADVNQEHKIYSGEQTDKIKSILGDDIKSRIFFDAANENINNINDLIESVKKYLYDKNRTYVDIGANQSLYGKYMKYKITVNLTSTFEDFLDITNYIACLNENGQNDVIFKYCVEKWKIFPSYNLIKILETYMRTTGNLPEDIPDFIINKECMSQQNDDIRRCECLDTETIYSFIYLNKCLPTSEQYVEFTEKNYLITTDPDEYEQKYKMKTPTKNLNDLKNFRFSNKEEKDNCSICLNDFESNEKVVRIPCCKKLFHDSKKCTIRTWLKENKKCPLCNCEVVIEQL